MTVTAWRPGEVILGLYEVVDAVHSGGMGVVHRVRHLGWNIDLAVKTPRPERVASAEGRRRFEAEAGTWVNLGLHPHTVNCSYVRTIGGLPRVFAEWVDGGSLADAVKGGTLYTDGPDAALRRILDIAVQMAWGLEHAHAAGLVHQDVKPANVMLEPDGTAKVTDFGLAGTRATAPGETGRDPAPGVTFGGLTRPYCSPEQALAAAGRREIRMTPATDMWSWGLTVLELFNGARPTPHGQAAAEALDVLLTDGPAAPTGPAGAAPRRVPAPPPPVVALLRRCFTPDPAGRPAPGEAATVLTEVYASLTGAPYPRRAPRAVELLAEGLSNHALSLLDLERVEEAEELWRRAAAADPNHPVVVYNRGLFEWRRGHRGDLELIADLEAARSAGGDPRRIDRFLGLVHLERDDRAQAVALLREAARADPGSAETAEALAEAESRPDTRPVILTGHGSSVTAVAVSADGSRVLSGDYDGRLRMWAVDGERLLRELTAEGAPVAAVAVDAGARTALVARRDGPLERWDLTGGERLPLPEPLAAPPATAVALSGDGRIGATGHAEGTLRFWDLATGAVLCQGQGHTSSVDSLALGADGTRALSGSAELARDLTARAWDVPRCRSHTELVPPADGSWSPSHFGTAPAPDARYALQIWTEGPMVLWDAATGRVLAQVRHGLRHVSLSALAPGGALALVGVSGGVRVVEPLTGRCLHTLASRDPDRTDDTNGARSAAVSADGRTAVLGLYQAVRVQPMPSTGYRAPWVYARPRDAGELTGHGERFRALLEQALDLACRGSLARSAALMRDAEAVPGFERHPELRDLWRFVGRRGRRTGLRGAWRQLELDGSRTFPTPPTLALSRDGGYFAAVRLGGTVMAWDATDGRQLGAFDGAMGTASSLLLTADGGAAVLHDDHHGSAHLLDLVSDRSYPLPSSGRVGAVAVSPSGDRVLTGEDSGEVRWCDVSLHREEQRVDASWGTARAHDRAVDEVALSLDGAFAASRASTSGNPAERFHHPDELCVWDVVEGELLWKRADRPHGCRLTFSPDGTTLLSHGMLGLTAFDTRTGAPLYTLESVNHDRLLAVTADGRHGVTPGHDTLIVFDLATGRVLRSIPDAGTVTALTLTTDGRFAVTGDSGHRVRLWDLDTGRTPRTLTGHRALVHRVALSDDGHRLLTADPTGLVRCWELSWDFDLPTTVEGPR
ncbi:protein kinase [Streptomyces sp. NPDC004610]|uniref:WD40 repeat domain-containing serine/threonine protein kinase n=1 Tax=unclassified Streptomyces TaxID=2593676 RepID=UPI0033A23BFC